MATIVLTKTITFSKASAKFEPRILNPKSLLLVLLEIQRKNDFRVAMTSILNNSRYNPKIVVYFGR